MRKNIDEFCTEQSHRRKLKMIDDNGSGQSCVSQPMLLLIDCLLVHRMHVFLSRESSSSRQLNEMDNYGRDCKGRYCLKIHLRHVDNIRPSATLKIHFVLDQWTRTGRNSRVEHTPVQTSRSKCIYADVTRNRKPSTLLATGNHCSRLHSLKSFCPVALFEIVPTYLRRDRHLT